MDRPPPSRFRRALLVVLSALGCGGILGDAGDSSAQNRAEARDRPMKQVIVVDESLQLPVGKLAAQVAHASLAAFLSATDEQRRLWLETGMTKVVLQADSSAQLVRLSDEAHRAGLPYRVIRDAGRTVVESGTVTCLGIGPAAADEVDAVTGELSLLRRK